MQVPLVSIITEKHIPRLQSHYQLEKRPHWAKSHYSAVAATILRLKVTDLYRKHDQSISRALSAFSFRMPIYNVSNREAHVVIS